MKDLAIIKCPKCQREHSAYDECAASDAMPCSLLPCPFCGTRPAPIEEDEEDIMCPGCMSAFGSCVHPAGTAREATIEKWNSRVDLAQIGILERKYNNAIALLLRAKEMIDLSVTAPESQWPTDDEINRLVSDIAAILPQNAKVMPCEASESAPCSASEIRP